ncbi:pre-mRNA-processing factor 17 [[Candida] railenensis]|uniref:Pre-mRNA-processing factor 17 n=1 Tax=[Candida] railenensis TaxID=45579 RepID=A0A9P0QQ56_9ASCO|nr:pre-mRNA-processing factor 17 [[Candida] railenensis]
MNIVSGYSSSSEDEGVPIPSLAEKKIAINTSIELEPVETITKSEVPVSTIVRNYPGELNTDRSLEIDVVKRKQSFKVSKLLKKKRKKQNDPFADDYLGPWADYEETDNKNENENENENDNGELSGSEEEKGTKNSNGLSGNPDSEGDETETLVTRSFVKYSYMSPPKALSVMPFGARSSFVPKKITHEFEGHSGGVNKMELFPETGHLLLTCGNDSKVKLWDSYRSASSKSLTLVREYTAHSQAVKYISFNSSGTRFVSCSYDRKLILWETESGAIVQAINTGAVPNVAIFNPNNENEIIVGLSNHKINHYEVGKVDPIQIYSHHLGAINLLAAVDGNKRFLSTADDKSVRFWDWQINIPVKVISEPTSHSMPRVALLPPVGDYIALQCMDNSIQVIKGNGKFKFNKNKKFKGHNVAGYGIDVSFSPDAKSIMSGDSRGHAYFWDWKTCKLIKKIKLDNKPITCIIPFPQEVSKVVSAGLEGSIYICE